MLTVSVLRQLAAGLLMHRVIFLSVGAACVGGVLHLHFLFERALSQRQMPLRSAQRGPHLLVPLYTAGEAVLVFSVARICVADVVVELVLG